MFTSNRSIVFHRSVSQPSFNPTLAERILTVTYEVRNLTGEAILYLANAVPLASHRHQGNGWTRVSAPLRDELRLLAHLENFHEYGWRKVAPRAVLAAREVLFGAV